jgi:Virulence-associated protein and related proteins
MKTSIIRIGNSRGIRLPKSVLEHCHLKDAVEIKVEGNVLTIHPLHAARRGWADAFIKMQEFKDDALLDADTPLATAWDRAEWRW